MTAHDEAALNAWLHADPAHRQRLETYRQIHARVGSHLETHLAAAVDEAARARTRRRRSRTLTGLALGAAATIALVFLISREPHPVLATATAERLATVLEDGTRVDLNARTSLIMEFREGERRVRLSGGEAFFSVVKDARRPFIVDTPSGSVRVTGTQFNVCTIRGQRVEVTVLEGTVRVRPAAGDEAEVPVPAGRQAVFDASTSSVRTLPEGAADDVIAWRLGHVVFDDAPLADAVERFAAYHARPIEVEPAVADLRLGGRFSLEDLDGFLDAIEAVLAVRVSHGPGSAVRIAPAAPR